MLFIDVIVLLGTQCFLITVGTRTAFKLLLRDYDPPAIRDVNNPVYLSYLIFSLTTSNACSLFLLVLCEISNVFTKSTRWLCWRINLYMLLGLIIVIIPWYQVYNFLSHSRGWKRKLSMYIATLAWLIYVYGFYAMTRVPAEESQLGWTEAVTLRTSTIGIALIAVLSGTAMVNTPYMTWMTLTRPVSEASYAAACRSYDQTCSILDDKRDALRRLQLHQESANRGGQTSSSFLDRLVAPLSSLGHRQRECDLLATEVEQLDGLVRSMKSDIDELERQRARSRFSHTWAGYCWNMASPVFAVYCVYRLVMTAINIVFYPSGQRGDPITNSLSLLISHLGTDTSQIDTTFWAQQLSFWFVGIIVLGSVRGFLKVLTNILRACSRTFVLPQCNVLMLIAHLMGTYFLSSVLLMQVSLPPEYRYFVSASLGNTPFTIMQRWSDVITLVAALITALFLYFFHQLDDAQDFATTSLDIQLSTIERGN